MFLIIKLVLTNIIVYRPQIRKIQLPIFDLFFKFKSSFW